MVRLFRTLVVLALVLTGGAARAIEPGDLTLTVTAEVPGNAQPFAREMVLLHLRGVYRTQILLEEVTQPALTNFSWSQLGRDTWGRTRMPDGQMALEFQRTVAVFAHHAGSFVIEPFTHKLTINDNGERRMIAVRSDPVTLPVAAWTGATGGPEVAEPWWLAARDVTIQDSWDPDPETIKIHETARRIVVLEAQGVLAEGLPPRPVMRTRGIVTFNGPVKRETVITPQGPVSRATYQWDVRPGVPEAIPLDAIAIPWFDTVSRTMREAEIPARQIGGGLPDREEDGKPTGPVSWVMLAATGFTSFGLGLALIGVGTGRTRLRLARAHRRSLRRAASADDAPGFRAALDRATREQPDLPARWAADPDAAAGLAALERHVYGVGDARAPDLAALARRLSRPHRVGAGALAPEPRLAPLDGPLSRA